MLQVEVSAPALPRPSGTYVSRRRSQASSISRQAESDEPVAPGLEETCVTCPTSASPCSSAQGSVRVAEIAATALGSAGWRCTHAENVGAIAARAAATAADSATHRACNAETAANC